MVATVLDAFHLLRDTAVSTIWQPFLSFLIDLQQQFVSPVSQHYSVHCLIETT